MGWLVVLLLHAGEEFADPGVHKVEMCRVTAVAFRMMEGTANVEITWEAEGCFGGTSNGGFIAIGANSARVHGTIAAQAGRHQAYDDVVSIPEARSLVKKAIAAVRRPEAPSACTSTTRYSAALKWNCGMNPSKSIMVRTHACGPSGFGVIGGGETRSSGGGKDDGYARAFGLIDVAESMASTRDGGLE